MTSTGWTLIDGVDGGKGSTNATWVYYEEGFKLKNGTVFKSGGSRFECSVKECLDDFGDGSRSGSSRAGSSR